LIVSNLTGSLAVFSSSTKQLVSNPITGTGSVVMNSSPIVTSPSLITPALGSPTSGNMAATTNIPVANATGTLAVGNGGTGLQTIPAGNVVIGNGTSAVYGLAPGTAGNVLTSIGGAWVSNAAVTGSGSPGGNTTEFQYNNGGAFAGAANLTTDGANTTIRSANTFRFANLTSTRYVGFKANAIVAANVTWTLPVADGTSGQVLSTDGTGNLSWITASGGPTAPPTVEYLVVAGGGGGGGDQFVGNRCAGGGGAGGYLTATGYAVTAGTPITVTIGGGGAGGNSTTPAGDNGTSSVFGSISTVGGGGGQGHVSTQPPNVPGDGGSGGGGRNGQNGGAGTPGQGFAGGNGNASTSPFTAGGGGGAAGVGGNASGSVAGNGGAGLNWNSLGTFYAGGGGGSADVGGTAGSGGSSIGGNGTVNPATGDNASPANRGSGGGGGRLTGGNGSGGIVIVRYADTFANASSTTGSPAFVSTGGFKYYTWTGNGSITF